MPSYKITEVHPDYLKFLPEYAEELVGKVIKIPHGRTPYEHNENSLKIGNGEMSLDGWVGFPPWFGASIDGVGCCPIAVKVEEIV